MSMLMLAGLSWGTPPHQDTCLRSAELNEAESLVETPRRVHVKRAKYDWPLPLGCLALNLTENRGADTLALPVGVNDDLPHVNVGGTLLDNEVSARCFFREQDLSRCRVPCSREETILLGLVPFAELLHHSLPVGCVVNGPSEFLIFWRRLPSSDPEMPE